MKINFFILLISMLLLFTNCDKDSESDLRIPVPEKVKYNASIKPIMDVKCNSCHNGSNLSIGKYNTYADAKNNINGILDRIQKNNGDALLMPQNGPKMSQADINLFIKWKTDGLLE